MSESIVPTAGAAPRRGRNMLRPFFALAAAALLASCGGGGGGGGGDFIGAANVRLTASPATIDTGDRALVSTEVSEVHPNGIILKYRFPEGLRYVPRSATLLLSGEEIDAGPSFNQPVEDEVYLVFFFDGEEFANGKRGTFTFELEALGKVSNGQVEVDADVDDVDIPNEDEFDPESPEFEAEDIAEINVVG